MQFTLAGSIPLGVLGARCYGRTTLAQGQSAFVALSWADAEVPANHDQALAMLNTTVDYWRDWLSSAKIPGHPWKPYLDRSALTLKGAQLRQPPAVHLDQDRGRDLEFPCRLSHQARNSSAQNQARLTIGISGAGH